MNVWIMVNTRAGRQRAREFGTQIEQAFGAHGITPRVEYTQSLDQARAFLEEGVKEQPQLLICCGGDGTLSQAVHTLEELGDSLTLGYIPMGTTNDFASSLGLSRDPAQAAEQILQGTPHGLDLGCLGDRNFLYVASLGAFTQSSYRTAQGMKSALGHLAYILESVRELPSIRPCQLQVEGEDFSWEGEFLFGAVTNSTSVGGMIKLDPSQVGLDDGLLELTLVKMPRNPLELGEIARMISRGRLEGELVLQQSIRQAEFRCAQAYPWSLDGEYFPGGEQLRFSLKPGAIRLVY